MIRVLEFRTTYRVGKEPYDEVLIAPVGADFEKTQTWHRVKNIRPPESVDSQTAESLSYKDMKAKWTIIGPAYEAWRNGQELPETGTPLEAWSGVTADQARFMRNMGVRTVEDVRDAGDATLEKLKFPNARQLPKLAKSWLEGAAVAEKDAQIAEMEERMKAMQELLEEKMGEAKPKRGPGRPKKETEAA